MTLKEESLAENKALGLEQMQEQMDVIFAVLHEHGINSRLWMEEYFTASQANGLNVPADFEKFLPWNLSSETKKRLSKDSTFSYGNAQFLQTNDGTVYHLRKDGTRVKIIIGDLTAEEFARLTGVR
jgi:hypothetical protein